MTVDLVLTRSCFFHAKYGPKNGDKITYDVLVVAAVSLKMRFEKGVSEGGCNSNVLVLCELVFEGTYFGYPLGLVGGEVGEEFGSGSAVVGFELLGQFLDLILGIVPFVFPHHFVFFGLVSMLVCIPADVADRNPGPTTRRPARRSR